MNSMFEKSLSSSGRVLAELAGLTAAGLMIGAAVAPLEVIFTRGLDLIASWRAEYGGNFWLLSLPLIGLLVVWIFSRFGGRAKEGMSLVFKINQGLETSLPARMIPLMISATWLSHIGGASVGKEGVGMQIGAAVSHLLSRWIPWFSEKKSIFLLSGMAAGFSGLFGTPMTGVFFAMEIFVSGLIEFRALAPSISAAFSASIVASWLGGSKESFPLSMPLPFDPLFQGWKLIILGVLFGLMGSLFVWTLHKAHHFFETRFPNPFYRIGLFSFALIALLWICMDGRYCDSGVNLIDAALKGETIYPWDFILKYGLSILSLSIGFIGGEVTPLFAVGASLGAVLGPLFGLPAMLCAALGYAAVFGAGTNTWLAPMMIGMEVFGYEWFPFFFIVCSTAYLVNGNLSIYGLQRKLKPVYLLEDHPMPSSSPLLEIVPEDFDPFKKDSSDS